jgi:hypothetical protein
MASGIIQNSSSIAANTQVDDVLVNQILAFNRQGLSLVDWGIVGSATGLLVSIFTGVFQQAPEFAPSLANRFPIFPDDFGGRFGAGPADRIMLRARNTTGGALTVFFAFRFTNVNQ